MPDAEIGRALRDSVEEVLEKMFFAQPLDEPLVMEEPSSLLAVKVTFEGVPSGALTLTVGEPVARQIAADFLAEDDAASVNSKKVSEVVCELANMICGAVLSRVESHTTFRLGTPRLLVADQWRFDIDSRVTHTIHLESGSLTAAIETREALCPVGEKSAS